MKHSVNDRTLIYRCWLSLREIELRVHFLELVFFLSHLMQMSHRSTTEHEVACVSVKLLEVSLVHCVLILKVFMHRPVKIQDPRVFLVPLDKALILRFGHVRLSYIFLENVCIFVIHVDRG